MSKSTKILLTVFWLCVLGGLLYWLYSQNMTHWITYTNAEYGFTLSLPQNFRVDVAPNTVNDSASFDYIVTGPNDRGYLDIRAYNTPKDYKVPTGPFPMTESNEKFGATTNPLTFNGISGFETKGAVEGGGGAFDYFEFVHNGKVWTIEFLAEDDKYYYSPNSFDMSAYARIRDSFKLI